MITFRLPKTRKGDNLTPLALPICAQAEVGSGANRNIGDVPLAVERSRVAVRHS
jgi:hypothetical protein